MRDHLVLDGTQVLSPGYIVGHDDIVEIVFSLAGRLSIYLVLIRSLDESSIADMRWNAVLHCLVLSDLGLPQYP
jgi:hypothetical protein